MNHNLNLTCGELWEISLFTVQKINNYPKHYGKTVDNYFDLLFPDEVKNYICQREINQRSVLLLADTKG